VGPLHASSRRATRPQSSALVVGRVSSITPVYLHGTQKIPARRSEGRRRGEGQRAYSTARKELRRAIRLAQVESWKKLCLLVDEYPWGLPYRVVMKRLGARTRFPEGRELAIATALFPSRPEVTWSVGVASTHPALQAELFNMDELALMASRLPRGKAPGPDYIPNEVVAELARARPAMLLDLFNKCLVMSIFPARWKVARLVLVYKGNNKPQAEPSSYRPLSLLDGVGKLFERLILCRLNAHLDANDSLSNLQFGFRRGRSTSDALRCVIEQAERAARGPARVLVRGGCHRREECLQLGSMASHRCGTSKTWVPRVPGTSFAVLHEWPILIG